MNDFRTRYLIRIDRLKSAAEAAPARPIGSPEKVGEVLGDVGAGLRRLDALGIDEGELSAVLGALDPEAVRQWADSVDVESFEARLVRAADEAFEATLPESTTEVRTWGDWALQGLSAWDDLESALVALEAMERKRIMDTSSARGRLGERLRRTDRRLRAKARWFVGLNRARRAERDLLDPAHRERAWWYASRSSCDDLVRLLAGELEDSPHVDGCEDCGRDLAASGQVTRRRARHVSGDDLWRYDLGLVSDGERVAIEQHARACIDCGRAVRALADGDEAIADLSGESITAARAAPPPVRARTRELPGRVLVERPDWRLELRRREGRVVLRVNGRGTFRIGFASAKLAGQPTLSIGGDPGGSPGLELDLGEEGAILGRRVRVVLEGRDGRAFFDGDVEL